MQAIAPAALLSIWESGSRQRPIERALLLLAAVRPDKTPAALATLSIGQRDEMLLSLREHLFGPRLKNMSVCPKCAEVVEWENDTRKMHLQSTEDISAGNERSFTRGNICVNYRLPDSNDLMKVSNRPWAYLADPFLLLSDCIISVKQDEKPVTLEALDKVILQDIDEQLNNEDPQANIGMVLNCPACKNTWEAGFDIVSYLWAEIDVWANHLLHEVYLLASAFGWAEADILNMSRQRRLAYIKLINS